MLVLNSLLILIFFLFTFFFRNIDHSIEKMYPNGLLKDAINNRSILPANMRFSHDRSSNDANDATDADGKTTSAGNSTAATPKETASVNEEVRNALHSNCLRKFADKHGETFNSNRFDRTDSETAKQLLYVRLCKLCLDSIC